MNRTSISIALILAAAATTAAGATSDADILRCAALAARDVRLDCYDALARQLPKAAASTSTPIPATPALSAPASAGASAPAPAVSLAGAQAPNAVLAADDPRNFGLTAAQQHTVDVGLQMITASISNLSSNQKGETFIVLDNGQTWSVSENDGWLATGQAVRIKRAAMRSYLLLNPANHTYHVRRLK